MHQKLTFHTLYLFASSLTFVDSFMPLKHRITQFVKRNLKSKRSKYNETTILSQFLQREHQKHFKPTYT
ncbi:hypothetical protein AAZX31_03G172300 [Glycine max]